MSADKSIMIIGNKETFLIRSMMKKLEENKVKSFFVEAEVNALSAAWEKADLITWYLEKDEKIKHDVLIYLNDQLSETNKRMIVVGDRDDVGGVVDNIGASLILEVYQRPLDMETYIQRVHSFFADGKEELPSILIIDDDPTYMGVIRGWLRDNYHVSMATSGTQAMMWLAKNHADLILLDYEMPVVSGPQVLEMLRSEPNYKNIPVFFLTAKSDKNSVMRVLELKPENYLLKTITREELIFELTKYFVERGYV